MELELYDVVYCVKQLTPNLLGKLFTVKTDHKNLVYLANSSIPKLVRWRELLSEFRFLVPGVQNVVADGLTRVMSLSSVEILASKRHMFIEDRIPRIVRLEGERMMIAEVPGDIEDDDEEGALGLEDFGKVEKRSIFARYHNSIVRNLGA
jgi:hypothetical protein